jgi:hypothetical protein
MKMQITESQPTNVVSSGVAIAMPSYVIIAEIAEYRSGQVSAIVLYARR